MARAPKSPTVASQKKVTPENLANLGAARLAEILAEFAQTRPDLKRRLRMELAAEQGADHLVGEIDKRLASLETSRSKVSWRKRATFVADLEGLRQLIAERLTGLDPVLALDRLWTFMDLTRRLGTRVKDRDGSLGAVFARAANDIGALLAERRDAGAVGALVEAITRDPGAWRDWLRPVLAGLPEPVVASALAQAQLKPEGPVGWGAIVRLLADAAGDVDAFAATFSGDDLRAPQAAAQVALRLMAAGRVEAAGDLLKASAPGRAATAPDFGWETAWIEYLDRSGAAQDAQAVRWASFERTLSVERARAFVGGLSGFDDVEADQKAREHAARHADFEPALRFLMDWPALPEAAAMINARGDEIDVAADDAELWAGRLRTRHPAAAHALLRKAAAAAFKRREFAACDRLTLEADTITLD